MDEQRPDIINSTSVILVTDAIELRPISANDQRQLWELMVEVYPKAYAHLWEDDGAWYLNHIWNTADVERELKDTNALYYFVTFQQKDIGILRIVENADFVDRPSDKALKIHRLYLDDTAQGKGVGKAIMTWAEAYARETGHQGIWLEVMDTKTQALKFYQRCGYEITSDFRLDFTIMHAHFRGMHKMYKAL